MSVVQPGRKWKKASAFMLAAALFCSVPLSGCSNSQEGGSRSGHSLKFQRRDFHGTSKAR